MRTCLAGIDRDEETESRIEDHKSCGGASGDVGRDSFIILESMGIEVAEYKR